MTYISGICNNVNPGPTLYGLMEPALTTAGFTLVDTVVISARTHQVWKSAAASNAANLDWYLDIGYPTTGAGNITLQCFEYYDPATDLGYRGLFTGANVVTIDAATSSRYGATGYALETNWIGATTFTSYDTTIPASAFDYFISVTADRIIMLVSGSLPQALTYVGLYTPDPLYAAKAGSALYPLVGFLAYPPTNMSTPLATAVVNSTATAALTRIPPASSMLNSGWGQSVTVFAPYHLLGGKYLGYTQVNYPEVAVPLLIGNSHASNSQAVGGLYGVAKDIAYILHESAARGDTVTISGATWVTATVSYTTGLGQTLLFKAI